MKICAAKLDRIYTTRILATNKFSSTTVATDFTDHLAIALRIELRILLLRRRRGKWRLYAVLLGDIGSNGSLKTLWKTRKVAQARNADLNLWLMEYAKPKLRKFWQAEGRKRANDMSFKKTSILYVYMRS